MDQAEIAQALAYAHDARDRDDVRDLLRSFFAGLDERRCDRSWLRSVFAESALVEFPSGEYAGVASIRDAVRGLQAEYPHTLHGVTDHAITLAGDTAHVTAVVHSTHVSGDQTTARHRHAGGRVGAEAVRTPDGWRLRRLAVDLTWTDCD
ncbi:nuclear transport factor 2 family protein [Solicola gregarius]|uniref:Nuclear transport factor 2 family protein n=1 Tax=Solicola gregarius TaxID=2908642 RepID=A0AA46TL30_9ACTN|nr:nuclear transport factor 2 family protein [Solicola gregarius]UYM06887.1 nuclear transport factor 2 family protein [Solicola gregarius]